jgi:multidrug efflux system membrane fusion protein
MIRRISKRWVILIIIAVVAAIVYLIVRNNASVSRVAPRINVNVSPVIQKDVTVETTVIGNVQAYTTVNIKSSVDGQLVSVGFKEGDIVKANQVLFTIDQRPFQITLAQVQATLARDRALLSTAQSALKRNTPLLEKGFISQQDFDAAQNTAAALTATIQVDEAMVNTAKLQLDYCTIKAPIEGRTGSLLVHAGNLVKANDPNALVVINQLMPINVVFNLPENKLPEVQREFFSQQSVPVFVSGVLTFINNAVDMTTGTIQMKAIFPNTDNKLWPGEFVRAKVPIAHLSNAKLVPTTAIQAGPKGTYVFVVTADNHVKLQLIKVGPDIGDETVIADGLTPGTLVVTAGQLRLTEGASIKPTKGTSP